MFSFFQQIQNFFGVSSLGAFTGGLDNLEVDFILQSDKSLAQSQANET